MVDKIIAKRLSRATKDIEAKIEAERKEAEELAKLSEAEKQKKLNVSTVFPVHPKRQNVDTSRL